MSGFFLDPTPSVINKLNDSTNNGISDEKAELEGLERERKRLQKENNERKKKLELLKQEEQATKSGSLALL